jgi:pimeloyl-ACP methyl ester carboxylesterase
MTERHDAPRVSRPSRPRLRTAAFALPLLVLLALLTGARCYPPGTRIVIFMQGIYTSYDATGTQPNGIEAHRFDALKAGFVARGYGASSLLDFSYAGGAVDAAGAWRPAPYECALTDRSPADNLAPLEQMLADLRRRKPGAHFTLVGHSLGGYLAFLEGAREAARPDAGRLGIDVVVTLDAPIKGISPDKKVIIDLLPCDKTYLAGADIVAAKLDPATPGLRRDQSALMANRGIRLATLGNTFDCLYNTAHCAPGAPFVDDGDTQFLPGQAAVSLPYSIESPALLSHDAIVADPDAIRDAVAFVGAP